MRESGKKCSNRWEKVVRSALISERKWEEVLEQVRESGEECFNK